MEAHHDLKNNDPIVEFDEDTVERLERGKRPKCLPVLLPTILVTPDDEEDRALIDFLLTRPNLKLSQSNIGQLEESHLDGIRLMILLIPEDHQVAVNMIEAMAPKCDYFIVVGADTSTGILREAMRAGAMDYIPLFAPPEELNRALFRVAEAIAASIKLAPTIVLLNSKGGCGASFLSGALADQLALKYPDEQVVLVDGDLLQAGQSHLLNVEPEYFFHDALSQAEELDYTALTGMMVQMDNLHLLPAEPFSHTNGLQIDYHQLPQLLFKLRSHYQRLVVDLSRGPESWANPILLEANFVLLVLQDNLASLRNAGATLRHLVYDLGLDKSRIQLVLNRYSPGKGGLGIDDVKRTTGIEVVHTVRNDFNKVNSSLDEGKRLSSIGGRDPLTNDIRAICDELFADGKQPVEKAFWAKFWR